MSNGKWAMKILRYMMVVAALGCIFVTSSQAIYTWTDEHGVKHFSDTEPEVKSTYIGDVGSPEAAPDGAGGNDPTMKMPVDGGCEDPYFLIEDVCVHPTGMDPDAEKMKEKIEAFKRTGNPPAPMEPSKGDASGDLCGKAKQKLEKYLREGVMGINPLTGKLAKMTGDQAEEAIQNAQDDVDTFCED